LTRRADAIFAGALAVWSVYLVWRVASLPLMEWDEARNVMNAYEMVHSGDWIAARYGGELDHYNLKPPLFMWMLAALFATAGCSELIARLPSIAFGLATAALVYRFVKQVTGAPFFAAVAGLGLVTAASRPSAATFVCFYGHHGLTSADVDVALTFFTTLAFVAVYRIGIEGRPRWYLVFGAALGLGFLTKSLVGLLPVGLVPVALAVRRDASSHLNRWLPAGVAIALLIAVPWLAVREARYPDDYVRLAFELDVVARITEVVEAHWGDSWFHLDRTLDQLGKWFYLALFTAFGLAAAPAAERRTPAFRAAAFAALGVVFYYVAFTTPTSKLLWYFFPAYPLILIIGGIGLARVAGANGRRVAMAAGVLLLVWSLAEVARYDRARGSGNPLVDHVLTPHATLLLGQPIITQGDIRQNGFALTRIYSGLRAEHFPDPTPLDEMLARAHDAAYLVTAAGEHYHGKDPRLHLVTASATASVCSPCLESGAELSRPSAA
jgi:4-amino-4-deoxy-L-arabinose transferase-like glycosyltransferase